MAIFDVNDQGLQATAAGSERITAFRCDISLLEEVNAGVAEVAAQLGPIDLLVHAAALMPSHLLIDHTHEGMALFRINYFGTTTWCGRCCPPCWPARPGACFGSIAGIALVPRWAPVRHQGRSMRHGVLQSKFAIPACAPTWSVLRPSTPP